jgi:hypothetical protein
MPEPSVGAQTAPQVERFPSMTELLEAHIELRRSRSKKEKRTAESDLTAVNIRAFIARVRASGAVLPDKGERRTAQGILDYWSTELLSVPGATEGDFTPALLQSFDGTRIVTPESDPAAPTEIMDDRSRELIRLAAAARLWRDSGRQFGYLLLDSVAIAQAARFRELDPDISELVAASEVAARTRWRTNLAIAVAAALALVVVGVVWYFSLREQGLRQYADLLTTQTNAQLEQARTAAEDLQKKIDFLQKQLLARGITAGTDTASTETVKREVAQTIRLDKAGLDRANLDNRQSGHQDGFIWIGSDTSDSSNLENPTTNAPVLPRDVMVDGHYRVTKNLVFREGAPSRSGYSPTDSIGVVPEGTLVTALAVPEEPYARPSGNQYWLKITIERSQVPIVYLQYTTAPPAAAALFAAALRQRGYQIPGVEATPLAKGLNEVKYYYVQDKEAAGKLARDTTATLRAPEYRNVEETKVVDMIASRGARNFPGVIELWLDLPARAQ